MAENENKLKNQISNLESSLNLQKDFSQRLSNSAARDKSKVAHNCLACFDESPGKYKSPKLNSDPDAGTESSTRNFDLLKKANSYNDNLDQAGMMLKMNALQKKLETEMKKNCKLEEEKKYWKISQNDMMGVSTRNSQHVHTPNLENDKGNYGKNYNKNEENMSEESITGTTGERRRSHRKSNTERTDTYKENFDSDIMRYALKGKNSKHENDFIRDFNNSRRQSRNRSRKSRSTSLSNGNEKNLSPNVNFDRYNNGNKDKLNSDLRKLKKDERPSQREPKETIELTKAQRKIYDLEKNLDKKTRELKFYKQEINVLQSQNEKLLNCGFENKDLGKLDINDLVLENNRLKEIICSKKR